MSNITALNGTIKIYRNANWIDVTETPFAAQVGDLVQCFSGAWCRIEVAEDVFIHLADNGDAANRCYCGGGSSYYYPRR